MKAVFKKYFVISVIFDLVIDALVVTAMVISSAPGWLVAGIVLLLVCTQVLELRILYSSLSAQIAGLSRLAQSDNTAKMLRTKAEFNVLQSQINPHFLYNTLEIIRSNAAVNKIGDVMEMTEALGLLFRYSISNSGNMATLEEELDNVDNYLLIQQYRFPGKIHFEKHIEDAELLKYKIPKLTIQPLIENSIYHGLETKLTDGMISIRAFTTQSQMHIVITDDGTGMSEERLKELRQHMEHTNVNQIDSPKGTGIALINVNQRIKFYYGDDYGIRVWSVANVGTIVKIVLPLNNEEKRIINEDRESES